MSVLFWDLRKGTSLFGDSVAGNVAMVLIVIAALAAVFAALALTHAALGARKRRNAAGGLDGQPVNSAGKTTVETLTYCAICIALAVILAQLRLLRMPQGGSVTLCSMLFIVLAGYWFGPRAGIIAGISAGLLRFAISSSEVMHPIQVLLDYPLAMGALGLSGFFRKMKYGLFIGYIAGCLSRLLISFISGLVFFASYAVSIGRIPAVHSAVYNLTYILPEMGITLALLAVPQFRGAIDKVKVPLKNK